MEMHEDAKDYKISKTGEFIPEKPKTAVEIIKSVMEVAIQNRQVIDEKKAKISGAIAQTRKAITSIETPAHDEYINKLIVKANNTVGEMEALRKAYTGKVNAWLKEEIKPENDLKLEIAPLIEMRNARAKKLAGEAQKKIDEIQKEKDRKTYEAEVKGKMKFSFESGVIDKVVAFEKSVEDYFMKNLTPANKAGFKAKLEGFKPNLKEDFFLSLFQVDYDEKRMTPTEFDDLVKRAKTYFIYEKFNQEYQTSCKEILQKWIDKIDSRVKELEIIAKGGEQAERVNKIVNEREAERKNQDAIDADLKKAKAQAAAADQVAGEVLGAEFQAQAQGQKIEQPAGSRNKDYFIIDNPEDTIEVARAIASIMAHTIPNYSLADRLKLIVQHDKDGKPKKDADGDPEYTPGVRFWLDLAATMKTVTGVKGLTKKTRVTAVNKAK